MLVRDYMTRHPLMVQPTMCISDVQRYMAENNLRHLPVVGDGKRLVGLVTKQSLMVEPGRLRSLNVWEISRYLTSEHIDTIMIPADQVITITGEATIEEAAHKMIEERIGCLPVVEEGIVVGIITETDLLAQLSEIMARSAKVPGVRATVQMPNIPGTLAKMVNAISSRGWGILALGGAVNRDDPMIWDAVVKIPGASEDEVREILGQVEGHQVIEVRPL
jgi:acetoin utilization protein AcuB